MKHTISVLVTNEFGVLSRISGLFSGRGYNIESLCVAETADPMISRMTIVSVGEKRIIEQILKQLNKLVNVVKVHDLTGEEYLKRELALIKVNATVDNRTEILSIVEIFRAKVVDVGIKSYTVEITGDEGKIEAMIELLRPFGIKEMARTGRIAMGKTTKTK
ncbi:MAG: acetolactate synthase small subunit [Deltaproteobacteria bacterium]|nr:acetolactate synthase small subunit [Deltaproteobacteria bacterium]